MKTILITGGSGLVGSALTKLLLQKNYQVHHLSRKENDIPGVKNFTWNIETGEVDDRCIDNVDAIVHLAGEGIAEKRWTPDQKKKIVESRTESIRLLYNLIGKKSNAVKSIISASGVGIYGNRGDETLSETSEPGRDFLAKTCIQWEKAVDEITELRKVKLRTSLVLSSHGGALEKMEQPIKLGIGSALGSGKQWTPWIHLEDLASMYLFILENEHIHGHFHAATMQPLTNLQLIRAIAQHLNKPLWAPAVPAFALKLILGEMSAVVLNSTKLDGAKIQNEGFRFKFNTIDEALKDIYGE